MVSRQRELFPLPPAFADSCQTRSVSRSVHRRLVHKAHWQAWANDGVATLNALSGRQFCSGHCPGDAHSKAMTFISGQYSRVAKPPSDETLEGAFNSLLGASTTYVEDVGAFRAIYSETVVSWPPEGSVPVDIVHHLPVADSLKLSNWRTSLLRSEEEAHELQRSLGLLRPLSDPKLVRDPVTYARFLGRLFKSGMVSFHASKLPVYLGCFLC